MSGFGCIEVQSGVTVTVKNGTLAGKSNGNFARGAAGSSISLENVTIDFEGLNEEVKPAIATDGELAVSNVTFDLVNAEAIDKNTAVTYQTLWDELNLAADGAVVSLKENAVLDKQFKFTEGKKLTLDLGEYTLTIGEGMGNVCALDVRSGSLTIRAGAKGAIDGTQADETTVPVGVMAQGATLTIESGTITTDTKYESCVYAGFGGIAYIEGGKFVNLCEEPFAYDQTSPALAVNVHDNTSGQQMVISGGTFVGRNPVLDDTNVNRTESYMAAGAKVAGMADGSFVAFAGEEVPEGAVAVYAQSADEVSAEVYTAEALAAALADGNFETVVLGADMTASVSVERTVTLDLNGKTLTNVAGKHTIENYGTLTVIGEGTVDNVSHGRGAVVNYGTAYLNGGMYTRSLENGQNSEDSGGNSWYVLKNYGSMTIDGAKVTQDGHYSSMIANGYQNAGDRNTNYGKVTTADKVPTLVIESGEFAGGINTVKNDDYAVMTINGGTFKNVSQAAVLNWNELTITDGVFEVGEAAQAAIITSYAAGGYDNGTTTISGGTFKGAVTVDAGAAYVKYSISGGNYSELPKAEYFAEGFAAAWDEETQAYVTQEGTYVATIGEYGYTTLAEAIAAADGETVKLIADVTENVTIEKSVTIDLNGYSISSAQGYAIDVIGGLTQEEKIEVVILSTGEQGTVGSDSNNVGLNVKNFADVTVENVYAKGSIYGVQMGDNGSAYQTVVTMKDSKAEGTGFAGVYVMGTSNAELPVTLKAENSEFIGYWYGVTGNGTYHNTYIELVNCTVTGTAGDPDSTDYANMGYGIYQPQDGTLIIDGGTVTGVSAGIEIRSGKLVVKGGAQITGTCKTLYVVENGSGTTVSGAAVAVSQHSTQKPIDVTIEEGTLTGLYALYETDTYATATPSENVEISVTGGTLVGEIHSDNKAGFISGGRFSAQPAEEYFDPDYAAVYRDGWYVTVESTVLRVAQAQAQADVRMYAAALGLSWSDVESNAAQVIELYDAIAETFSEKAVVDAKLAAMEALEAYAEEVKAAEEEAAEAQALAQAKTAAQEEVRDYAAMLGTTWTAIANAEGAEAAAAVEKYNAIADAADTQGVADAKLAAKQAVEAYVAAVNAAEEEAAAAWAQAKQDAIAALEQWRDENAEGIVIPTSVYLAVNSAETQDELNTYIDSAKAELSDILTYRGQIAALAEDLGKQMTSLEELSATLTALDEALTGENNYFELQLTDIEEIVAKANAEIKQAVEDAQAAIVSGDADSESLASLKAYLETINNETLGGILTAVNGLGNELAGVDTALSGLSSQLSGLSGALTDVGKTIEESIAATQTKVQSIIDQLGSLATGDDITAVTGSLTAILEDIAKVQETVDAISVEVNVVTEVTEVKTQAYSDIKAWLDEYLDEIIGTDSASADVFTLRAYTPETTDGEIYAKLTKAFSEDNAKLVLKYYNEALASIDAAKTVSDVTTAVSTFKAQVASVEAAAQNTPDVNLTAVYVLLAVLLVGVVAAIVILLVRKAPAQAAVAEEAAPAPAEA